MADPLLGRRLVARVRLARYERQVEAAVARALARARARVTTNALTAAGHPDPFGTDAWDADLQDEVAPMIRIMLDELIASTVGQFPLDSSTVARVMARIDVEKQLRAFLTYFEGMGPGIATSLNIEMAIGVNRGESILELADRVKGIFDMADRRASTIARTETNRAANASGVDSAAALNDEIPLTKTWLSTQDARTRDDHLDMDGTTVAFNELFVVGGEEAEFPCDPNLSAEQSINCRCCLTYDLAEDATPDQQAAAADLMDEAAANSE